MKKFLLALCIVLLFISTNAFGADIYYVPADQPTIQAGIDAAGPGDYVIVSDDTYTGYGNKNLDFGGKAITVQSKYGPGSCIIDSEGDGQGFYFHSSEGVDSVVSGFTITGGNLHGGGIYCENSSPTITNCIITGNNISSGIGGGGVYCDNSSPVFTKCTISQNSAVVSGGYGGGVYCLNNASPSFTNCNITDNAALLLGGGFYCDNSPITVMNCTIARNMAPLRAGFSLNNSPAIITNSIVWGNLFDPQIGYVGSIPAITYSDIQNGYSGTGNIDQDPLFVDEVGGDYHLQGTSPCINTATSTGAPASDWDGDVRPNGSGFDMGADERGIKLAVDFGTEGLWHFDGSSTWVQLSIDNPSHLANYNGKLHWSNPLGLYEYDGTTTRRITDVDAEVIMTYESDLLVDFGAAWGIWEWNGSNWRRLTDADTEDMVVLGSTALIDFGAAWGIWEWNGASWRRLTDADPEDMIVLESVALIDFGAAWGLWAWNGSNWTNISPNDSEDMAILGSTALVDFGAGGLRGWNGTLPWQDISPDDAEAMASCGQTILIDFGSLGLKQWDGSSFETLDNGDALSIGVYGNAGVADFGGAELYHYIFVTPSLITKPAVSNATAEQMLDTDVQ